MFCRKSGDVNFFQAGGWLSGGSVWGVLRGLETFYQLLYGNDNDDLFIKEVDIIGKKTVLNSVLISHNCGFYFKG